MSHGHEVDEHDHGSTPAAWTAVLLVIVGCTIGAFGVSIPNWWLFAAGIVVIALGGIAGKVLQMLGFGKAVTD